VDSHVERIKAMFAAYKRGGASAVAPFVDEEMELEPLTGEGKVYRGPAGLDEYIQDMADRGDELEAEPVGYEELGNCVVVAGRMRLRREEGSLTDSQVTWIYKFDGEKLIGAKAFPGRLSPEEAAERAEEVGAAR
jgi:hypothetical protein